MVGHRGRLARPSGTHCDRESDNVRTDGLSRRGFLTQAVLGSSAVVGLPWLDALAQAKGKTLTVAIPAGPTTLDPINAITHDPMVIMRTRVRKPSRM